MLAAVSYLKTRDKSFKHIHKIDESIGNETKEQSKMNRAQDLARLENGLLKQNSDPRFDQTPGNVLQLRCRSSLANRVDDGFESVDCEPRRCKCQQNKDDLFNRC